MKKQVLCLLSLALLLCACQPGTSAPASSDASADDTEKPHQSLIADTLPYESGWLTSGLSKAGLQYFTVDEAAKGRFDSQGTAHPSHVYLFSDYERYGEDGLYHDAYLAVETADTILFKDLADTTINGSYADALYVRDVDGDGMDEIILQQTVGMTGGAGQYLSRVFKVAKEEIQEVFFSGTGRLYDTGFTGQLHDGFQLEVRNRFTGYAETLDLSAREAYVGVYFDETGKVIRDDSIQCDSFFKFVPEDVDGDGAFEIVCSQYVSLYGHLDGIGYAKSVIKYNPTAQGFEVIDASFDPMR